MTNTRPRRSSVHGRTYVLHLDLGTGRTACGREARKVNCVSGQTPTEEICRACLAHNLQCRNLQQEIP